MMFFRGGATPLPQPQPDTSPLSAMTDSPTPAEATPERETFSSRIGFLFLSAGCAIGLGNVWRFPFITGQYGGAWFVLIYLLFLLFLGIPLVLTELACGRASQRSIARSFDVLEPPGTKWHWYKWIGMVGNYLLMMFYVPVTGWILCYAVKSARGDFSGIPAEESAARIGAQFQQLLDSPGVMVLYMAVVVILCYGICAIGLRKGVERITKYIMAGLFLLLIALAVNSLTLPGGKAGLAFYLKPDWSRLCEAGIGNALIAAMGQAFFTLGLGVGSLAIFGSHLTRRRTLLPDTVHITALDTSVAFISGLIIFPACFAFGVEAGSGPGLIFLSLPNVFHAMPHGAFWGAVFFLFMSFAALSTVIAVFENILSFPMDLFGWSRRKSVFWNLLAMLVLTLPCIFGFNLWKAFTPFGPGSNILDLEDFLLSNTILPVGALVYLLFCATRYGWGFKNFRAEVNAGSGAKIPAWLGRYLMTVPPVIVFCLLIQSWIARFFAS